MVDGARIRLPEITDEQAKDKARTRRQNSTSTSSADSGVSGLRPRLASILSATMSYFSSSLSSVSSSEGRVEAEAAEERFGLLPVIEDLPTWMRNRLFSLEAVDIRQELIYL